MGLLAFFLQLDASSQHGHEYFCVREDRIRYPRSAAFDYVSRARTSGNLQFESRICPISTLGKGHASSEKKSVNVGQIYLMESASYAAFDEVRGEVKGITTDQGSERCISDMTVRVLEAYYNSYEATDPRVFLFPWVKFIARMFRWASGHEEARLVTVKTRFVIVKHVVCDLFV